tara:strand:- start:906 stop:1121 length:216 start_codon:yes stop_codon:yes gene_type:complete
MIDDFKNYIFWLRFSVMRIYFEKVLHKPQRTVIFIIKYAPRKLRDRTLNKLFYSNPAVFKIFSELVEAVDE